MYSNRHDMPGEDFAFPFDIMTFGNTNGTCKSGTFSGVFVKSRSQKVDWGVQFVRI